jgi:hypothetical protein
MSSKTQERTKVFISYSHKDEKWLRRLEVHLRPLVRDSDIDIWDDKRIQPGSKWREEIRKAIESAKVAVLLVSADFLASDFIAADELPPLLNAAKENGVTILPVIVRPSRFRHITALSQYQAVNDPSKPLEGMSKHKQEEVFVKLSERVASAVEIFRSYREPAPATPTDPFTLTRTILPGSRPVPDPETYLSGHPEQILSRRPGDPIVNIYPDNFLNIVVGKMHIGMPIFNLDCHLVNKSAQPARVRWLEAHVTPPSSLNMQFVWNVFYNSSPDGSLMTKTAEARPLELGARDSKSIGVQFIGVRLDSRLLWPEGTYEFNLLGWVSREPRDRDIDLKTVFRVKVSGRECDFLRYWAAASDSEWNSLNDPDRAVAIPLTIDMTTLVVA